MTQDLGVSHENQNAGEGLHTVNRSNCKSWTLSIFKMTKAVRDCVGKNSVCECEMKKPAL